MTLTLIFFAFFIIAFFIIALVLTRFSMKGTLKNEGPEHRASHLRVRNRIFFGIVAAVVIILIFFEALSFEVHQYIYDLQYTGGSEPLGVIEFQSGGGVSLLLFLAILVGTLIGLMMGTWLGCRKVPILQGFRLLTIVYHPAHL